MDADKLVTIVIPVYNRESTIVRCLDSIAGQRSICRFSLIIVDNNSTDGLVKAINAWGDRHPDISTSLIYEKQQGAAAARNAGLADVSTPYVMFFDSDDEMLQGHLDRLACGITAHPDADILGWDICCELPNKKVYTAIFACDNPLRDHMIHSSMSSQRFAAKTDFVRQSGNWDASLTGWDDLELGARLTANNPRMVKLPDTDGKQLVKTYFSEDSITGSLFSASPEKWETALDRIEKTISDLKPSELKLVAFRRAALAGLYARENADTDARRLLAQATAKGFGKAKARAVFETARVFGRGTRFLASVFL